LGESNPHVITDEILHVGIRTHLTDRPEYQVFSNMNLYYLAEDAGGRLPYVSPDTMVVKPFRQLPETVQSYQIDKDGPAPLLTMEILSERSAQQRDQEEKVVLYAQLGVAEYILVDVTGQFLPQRLLLKRLQPDQTWRDEQDPDGGVTSQLGFRLLIEPDGQLRVMNALTGERYVRPFEAQEESRARQAEAAAREVEAEARRHAEARVHELEAELARLRKLIDEQQKGS
jgi:Uma2 family endonuclease